MPVLQPWHQNWLINVDYNRVDLVPEGANSEAFIVLTKSKGASSMDLATILAKLSPEHREVVSKELKAKDDELAVLAKEKQAAFDELENMKKAAEVGTAEQTEEEVIKSIKDPALRSLMETQIAKAKVAEAAVMKMRDEKDEQEAISKARSIDALGVEQTQLVDVLKRLKKADPALCDDVYGILQANQELVKKENPFGEHGTNGRGAEGGGSEGAAWALIEAKVAEITKSKTISKEAALAEVLNQNPEMYTAYLNALRA